MRRSARRRSLSAASRLTLLLRLIPSCTLLLMGYKITYAHVALQENMHEIEREDEMIMSLVSHGLLW